MNPLHVITLSLYSVVALTLIMNILQVRKESKELKAQGKTPLVGKNLITVAVASVGEVLLVTLAATLIQPFFTPSALYVVLTFTGLYLLKDAAAYLAAWGTWSIFVNLERRKMKKQIEKDQEEAV